MDERAGDPSPRPPRRRRKWAEHELGELLGRAWGPDQPSGPGPAPDAPDGPPATAAGWEVERLPSEAEGGVVGLLLGGRSERPRVPKAAPAGGLGPDIHDRDIHDRGIDDRGIHDQDIHDQGIDHDIDDQDIRGAEDAGRPARGRARLNDMIDRLPVEPVHRVTPDEVDVADPELAPPVVWFWGDDDIYPGKVPGIAQPVGVRHPKRRR